MHVPQRVIRPLSKGTVTTPRTEHLATASLPTRHGVFETHVFRSVANDEFGEQGEKEHVALFHEIWLRLRHRDANKIVGL